MGIIFLGSSIFLGKSITPFWQMINTLQLIQYSVMMTLYYPQILLFQFSQLSVTSFDFHLFSEIFLLHIEKDYISERESWDYRFKTQGIGHVNILMNWSSIFLIFVIILIYLFIIFILKLLFKKTDIVEEIKLFKSMGKRNTNKSLSTFKKAEVHITIRVHSIFDSFFFSGVFRIGFEAFLPILFSSIYHLYSMRLGRFIDIYSSLIAIISILLCIFMIIIIWIFYK